MGLPGMSRIMKNVSVMTMYTVTSASTSRFAMNDAMGATAAPAGTAWLGGSWLGGSWLALSWLAGS